MTWYCTHPKQDEWHIRSRLLHHLLKRQLTLSGLGNFLQVENGSLPKKNQGDCKTNTCCWRSQPISHPAPQRSPWQPPTCHTSNCFWASKLGKVWNDLRWLTKNPTLLFERRKLYFRNWWELALYDTNLEYFPENICRLIHRMFRASSGSVTTFFRRSMIHSS